MLKTIFLPLLIFLIGSSACSQPNPTTPTPMVSSGIEGYVTQGPVCPGPAVIGDTSCEDQPYQANITILDGNNTQIAQLLTDNNGYFKITLKPGSYILRPESGKLFPIAADQIVEVLEGQFTQISIQYDTGIR